MFYKKMYEICEVKVIVERMTNQETVFYQYDIHSIMYENILINISLLFKVDMKILKNCYYDFSYYHYRQLSIIHENHNISLKINNFKEIDFYSLKSNARIIELYPTFTRIYF
jgi:hypothetical protein